MTDPRNVAHDKRVQQEKKKHHQWITKFWKEKEVPDDYQEKEVPEKIYSDYQCYIAERIRNGFSGAAFDRYISLEGEDERYHPG